MWNCIQRSEVPNRDQMLPLTRAEWVLKKESRPGSAVSTRQGSTRPGSPVTSRPTSVRARGTRPSSAVNVLSKSKACQWHLESGRRPQSSGPRRQCTMPGLESPVAGAGLHLDAAASRCSPKSRCLRGFPAGQIVKEERIGSWPTPTHSAFSPSLGAARSSPVLGRARDKKTLHEPAEPAVPAGLVRAAEANKRFQAQLLEDWKRNNKVVDVDEILDRRRLCSFYDFLKNERGELDTDNDVLLYIDEAFANMELLEAEAKRAAPDAHHGQVVELSQKQSKLLRNTLSLYAQISNASTAGPPDVIHQQSFCRFIVDSRLVATSEDAGLRPPYHQAVRLFDGISKQNKDGFQRYANIEHCLALIGNLLGQTDMPIQIAWQAFEVELESAERLATALIEQRKKRVLETTAAFEEYQTEEAVRERSMEMFGKNGSPPSFFQGSLREWSLGLRFWVDTTNHQVSSECITNRVEQSFALEHILRDSLIEPGILHIVHKFGGLFRQLFTAYSDETKLTFTKEEGDDCRQGSVPHMSFAAFFRFCLDFSIFPKLCSFDEAWFAYRSAECVRLLGSEQAPLTGKLHKSTLKQKTTMRASSAAHAASFAQTLKELADTKAPRDEGDASDHETSSSFEDDAGSDAGSDAESDAGSNAGSKVSSSRNEGVQQELPKVIHSPGLHSETRTKELPQSPLSLTGQAARPRRYSRELFAAPAPAPNSDSRRSSITSRRSSLAAGDMAKAASFVEKLQAARRRSLSSIATDADINTLSEKIQTRNRAGSKESVDKPSFGKQMLAARKSVKVGIEQHPDAKDAKGDEVQEEGEVADVQDDDIVVSHVRTVLRKKLNGVIDLFSRWDRDGDGLVSCAEFVRGFKKTGVDVSPKELERVFQTWDTDGSGTLEYKELHRLLDKSPERCKKQGGVRPTAAVSKKLPEVAAEVDTVESASDVEKVRMKPCPDFSWMSKQVSKMTELELKSLSLLLAILDCCQDNFHDVHGILCTKKESSGSDCLLSTDVLMDTFKKHRITHRLNSIEMQEFIKLIDPSGNGMLDPFELQKAVSAVREHAIARRPMKLGTCRSSASTLGEEARRLSSLPVEMDDSSGEETPAAFSTAAFTECMLLLCSRHMHGSGVPAKFGSPGAARGHWLVGFLHHHFCKSGKAFDEKQAQQAEPKQRLMEHLPDGARYQSRMQALIQSKRDLFSRWHKDGMLSNPKPWTSESDCICSTCKRKRDVCGIGSAFCHVCSCVDAEPLSEHLLHPLLQRSRLRRQLASHLKAMPASRSSMRRRQHSCE
eukprot:TRINITY_DN29397_c0_g1_i1.p1 TRINITY_DN29397_c0_g1~~TRINITY_DN29397_c0_g1_i1.p1  ORF type:complete len:1282 (+),score=201.08 TRINITY_DN29397_c0_g1_i1:112-3957(+)